MSGAMPERWGTQLQDLSAQLQNGISAGDRSGNISLIRQSIIPLMSKYVDSTHDMGLPRRLLSLLTLDLARYENGSAENVQQAFHQLRGYSALKNQLGSIDDQELMALLQKETASASPASQLSDHLASAADMALRGEGSAETQQAFQQLVSAMLINESVYMPVNHYLLPFQKDGEPHLAELWVDPNAQDSTSKYDSRKNTVKLLLQIQVPSYGQFDVVLTNQERDVDIQIACPDGAVPFSKEIEQSVSQIIDQNGLTTTGIRVRAVKRPLSLGQVFPKILERKDSVNVKV
jgi:hypothetical protein